MKRSEILWVVVVVGLVFSLMAAAAIIDKRCGRKWQPTGSGTVTLAPVFSSPPPVEPSVPIVDGIDSLFGSDFEVPPPANHPPLCILVGHAVFRVAYYPKELFDLYDIGAAVSERRHLILFSPEDKTPEDDLLHELAHLAVREGGGFRADMEAIEPNGEGAINPMAPELRKILRNNPGLTRWLLK